MSAIKYITNYFFVACVALLLFAELREHFFKEEESKIVVSAERHLQSLERQLLVSLDAILNFKTEDEFHKYFIHGDLQKSGFCFLKKASYQGGLTLKRKSPILCLQMTLFIFLTGGLNPS